MLHALSDNGYTELAYTLLLQTSYPSWLFSVSLGATTMWEHWDGINENGDVWSKDMNSFNHYAYGAVGDWIYGKACGIQIPEDGAGFAKVRVAPLPDKRIGSLFASIDTRHGTVSSKWYHKDGKTRYEITVPVQAELVIDGKTHSGSGRNILVLRAMKNTRSGDMKVLAKETIERHELSSITPDALKSVLNTEGYMVIRYSAVAMSAQTKHLMEVLGVEQLAHTVDSFTFTDREHRIVFVRTDISDEEFVKLLALELGRIYCVKNRTEKVIHGTPNEEFAAAEFAYHLIDINRRGLLYNFFKFHAGFAITATFLFRFCFAFSSSSF